jgi:hypothetical protein
LRIWHHVLSQALLDGVKFDRFEISLNVTLVLRDGSETETHGRLRDSFDSAPSVQLGWLLLPLAAGVLLQRRRTGGGAA